jgi:hypothetical protein
MSFSETSVIFITYYMMSFPTEMHFFFVDTVERSWNFTCSFVSLIASVWGLGNGLNDQVTVVRFLAGTTNYLLYSKESRPIRGPTDPPVE